MMIWVLRIALSLGGGLLIFMGFGFLTDPAMSATDFGLVAEGAHGLTSIRADMTAFFCVAGGCLLWGVWTRRRDPLIIGAALMLVTLVVRLISLAQYGSFEGYVPPMVVELLTGVLAIVAARVLPVGKSGLS